MNTPTIKNEEVRMAELEAKATEFASKMPNVSENEDANKDVREIAKKSYMLGYSEAVLTLSIALANA